MPKTKKAPAATMTPLEYLRLFKRSGKTVADWAHDLGITERQSYRYAAGETEIPPGRVKLIRMISARV